MTTTTAILSSRTKRLSRAMSPSKKNSKNVAVEVKSPANDTPPQPEQEFTGTIKVSQKPPTKADLQRVADLPVLDKEGKSHTFRSLYSGQNSKARRVLILFVRHFFCGQCQEYLRTLSASVTAASIDALNPSTSIAVIGCGQPELISFYAEATSCPFPIYADPTKRLYSELGMGRTLNLGNRPDYIQKSLGTVMWSSLLQTLSAGRKLVKGGDYWQVGGEFLFETEPVNGTTCCASESRVKFCHRMSSTRDHASVPEVRRWLGLDPMPAPELTFRAPTPAPEAAMKTEETPQSKQPEAGNVAPKAKEDGDQEDSRKESKEFERPALKKRWTLAGSSDAVRRSLSIGRGSDGGRGWSRSRSREASGEQGLKEEEAVKEGDEQEEKGE